MTSDVDSSLAGATSNSGENLDREIGDLAEQIMSQLNALPVHMHQTAVEQLVAAAASTVRRDSIAPLRLFLDRLVATARLRRDPLFEKMLADADEAATKPPRRVTASDLFARLDA